MSLSFLPLKLNVLLKLDFKKQSDEFKFSVFDLLEERKQVLELLFKAKVVIVFKIQFKTFVWFFGINLKSLYNFLKF